MVQPKYKEIEISEIDNLTDGQLVLLVTATDLETLNLHQKIEPLQNCDSILKIFDKNFTYYIGLYGHYNIAHVQCSMGSVSSSSSILTVKAAIETLKPKAVIMVGIAFGMDDVKQKIGDVLISESIMPYNVKRVGKDKTIPRGKEMVASELLLNRLKNIRTWEFLVENDQKAEMIFTTLLSGEVLVDNLQYRNELKEAFPNSAGGEMEGAGIASVCGSKIDWILIKGICDFADGEKGIGKEKKQTIAIQSALSVCSELFNSYSGFRELDIAPVVSKVIVVTSSTIKKVDNIGDILFDLYDVTKEKFYIDRKEDTLFKQKLSQYALWVFGPSGCGKSNLILRNLQQNNFEVIPINLASCIGQEVEYLFYEILYELAAKSSVVQAQEVPRSFNECSRAIINILNREYQNKTVIILIEEIPIDSLEAHHAFSEKLFSLIISKNFMIGLEGVKFVLSSLQNPLQEISAVQNKIHQHMLFLPLTIWTNEDILILICLIEREIGWALNEEMKNHLIEKCNGSPRFIKKFFRSIFTLEKTDDDTLRKIIADTERELNISQ